jgi:hypothetical protein
MSRVVGLILVVVAVVALAACGGDDSAAPEPTSPTIAPPPAMTAEPEPDDSDYQECIANLGPFIDALREMDSRLNIGLNYGDYGDFLGDVQVEYDKVDIEGAAAIPGCIDVAADAEKAFNAYIKASNIWQKCFEDLDCDNDEITPRLQQHWSKATRLLEDVDEALGVMETT